MSVHPLYMFYENSLDSPFFSTEFCAISNKCSIFILIFAIFLRSEVAHSLRYDVSAIGLEKKLPPTRGAERATFCGALE